MNRLYEDAIRARMREEYPDADEDAIQAAIDGAQVIVKDGHVSIAVRAPIDPKNITVKIVRA